MSQIIPILRFEEAYKPKPYIDTEGFPTVGTYFKIGPKGAPAIELHVHHSAGSE
jgi:lysozyme